MCAKQDGAPPPDSAADPEREATPHPQDEAPLAPPAPLHHSPADTFLPFLDDRGTLRLVLAAALVALLAGIFVGRVTRRLCTGT